MDPLKYLKPITFPLRPVKNVNMYISNGPCNVTVLKRKKEKKK